LSPDTNDDYLVVLARDAELVSCDSSTSSTSTIRLQLFWRIAGSATCWPMRQQIKGAE